MWSLRVALSFHGLMTLSRRSIKPPRHGGLAVWRRHSAACSVRTRQYAEECRIAVRYPMTEGKTPDEDSDTREDGVEEIEGPHRSDAHEVEQRPFYLSVDLHLGRGS